MVKQLMKKGANLEDLTDISVEKTQSICEFGITVLHTSITQDKANAPLAINFDFN